MTEYNIRLNPNCAAAVHTGLKFKAGDKGITFRIAVDELDTTGTTAKIVFLRANGTSVESDISGTDGVYIYKTLGNEFAVPGKTVADVKFYASGNRESTASFVFEVCGDTMNGLGAGTGGYSDRLEQLVSEAEAAVELTEQAKAELEAAESNMKTTEAEMAAVIQNFKNQYGEVGALNPRGNWNSGVTYQIRDLVYYNSISWICLAPNTGVDPTDANIAYWMRSTDLEAVINGTTPVGKAKDADTVDNYHAYEFQPYEPGSDTAFPDLKARLDWETNHMRWRVRNTENSLFPVRVDDADTVDGYHASDFVDAIPQIRRTITSTFTLHDLLNLETATPFVNWTDVTNFPFQYGSGIVIPCSSTGGISTILYGHGNFNLNYARFAVGVARKNGSTWTVVWDEKASKADVLPLDGSVPMSGNLWHSNGYGRVGADQNHASNFAFNEKNSNANGRGFVAYNSNYQSDDEKGWALRKLTNGAITDYTVLHTGNSKKVVTSASAPSDTSALWYDTTNKILKRYVDGAWQA